jgi:ABC-type lipoprotein release transport system permease subunit
LVIISSLLAARLFPGQDPVGQQIKPTPSGPWYRVVGVAADVKNSGLAADIEPEYYQLRRNNLEDWQQAPSAALVVKTSLPPQAVAQWIRAQIGAIDPTVPVDVETLNEIVSRLADRPRFETALLGFFAVIGLLMAVIGLYGVIAYMAVQRTQEIGVRMALGAGRADILRLILSEGLRLVAAGTLVGLAAALAVSRVLRSLLFHVGPYDPASYIAVALLLSMVALAATLIPARAAMKTDPMAALRVD